MVKEVSLGNDGSISMDNLKNCINNDLANNYGNLCQRVFSFIKKNCKNKIPKIGKYEKVDLILLDELKNNIPKLIKLVNQQDLNEFIKLVVGYSFDGNKYFNDLEPWAVKKKDISRMNSILFTICEHIKNISILLNPIIPLSTSKVLDTMNINQNDRTIEKILNFKKFDNDKELKNLKIFFKKIEDDN